MAQIDVQQAIESVAETIEGSDDFIMSHHETQTRYSLIDPILDSLGWDIHDIEQVEVEYENEWGRADYALLGANDNPVIIVEAKRLGSNLDQNLKQLMAYSEGVKKGYAVITDGDIWKIYDLSKRGRFLNKLCVEIRITHDPARKSAAALNKLLRRNLHRRPSNSRNVPEDVITSVEAAPEPKKPKAESADVSLKKRPPMTLLTAKGILDELDFRGEEEMLVRLAKRGYEDPADTISQARDVVAFPPLKPLPKRRRNNQRSQSASNLVKSPPPKLKTTSGKGGAVKRTAAPNVGKPLAKRRRR